MDFKHPMEEIQQLTYYRNGQNVDYTDLQKYSAVSAKLMAHVVFFVRSEFSQARN